MSSTIRSVVVLLFSFMLLCLGHGLFSSLVSIRSAIEGFSNITIGLMGLSYFSGFLLGIYKGETI